MSLDHSPSQSLCRLPIFLTGCPLLSLSSRISNTVDMSSVPLTYLKSLFNCLISKAVGLFNFVHNNRTVLWWKHMSDMQRTRKRSKSWLSRNQSSIMPDNYVVSIWRKIQTGPWYWMLPLRTSQQKHVSSVSQSTLHRCPAKKLACVVSGAVQQPGGCWPARRCRPNGQAI